MNTQIRLAVAFASTLLALAAAAAEPPIPPSEALSDSKLQEVTGQKSPPLRPPQVDEIVPGALSKLLRKPQSRPLFKWPPGGCIVHPKGR